MKKKILYVSLVLSLFFMGCSKENISEQEEGKKDMPIEISFRVTDFTKETDTATRGLRGDVGSINERKVDNLYILLFNNTGSNPKRFFVDAASFSGGTWSISENKVTLDMTQTEAGNRQVYIVANVDNEMKAKLATVQTVTELTNNVFNRNNTPWSPYIKSPFLMSGNKSHNFRTNHKLEHVPLIRTVAKVELTIKLSEKFQSMKIDDVRYRYVNLDARTYVIKPSSKPDDLVTSSNDIFPMVEHWGQWGNSLNTNPVPDFGFGYTKIGSTLKELKVITYLNERDKKGAKIEIALWPEDVGLLPPPEFGPELYPVFFPDKIQRNHWYKYDIEI